jgi:DegV family protein with EDD domain
MVRLFTDTDTDVTPEVAAEYGYSLISMPYSIDGKTIYPYEDYDVFDSRAYYDSLREGVLPTTSALGEERYISYFEPVFAAGDDILYVHFSAAMSATFDVMHKALSKLAAKYPERRFYEIDTKGITTISLALVIEIGRMFREGRTPEELIEWAKTGVYTYAMYFFVDDLKFFRRSGRVSGLAATMGTLLGVRPIISMSADGKMDSIGTEKGKNRAMNRLIDEMERLGDRVSEFPIYIGHTDSPETAEQMAVRIRERFGEGCDVKIVVSNPTTGAHCGPNGVGVCFHAVHR